MSRFLFCLIIFT